MWGLPRKQPQDRFTGVNVKAGSEVVTCHSLAVEIALHSDSRGNYRQQALCRGQNHREPAGQGFLHTLQVCPLYSSLCCESENNYQKIISAVLCTHTSTNNRRSFFTRFASHSMDQTDDDDDHDNEIVYTEGKTRQR